MRLQYLAKKPLTQAVSMLSNHYQDSGTLGLKHETIKSISKDEDLSSDNNQLKGSLSVEMLNINTLNEENL